MGRLIRNTVILAKVETTYGTDAVPTGAANALLISNMSIDQLNANNVDRDVVRGYLGASEQLVGTANVSVSFDVELAGAGAAGSAPAWGALLRGCGFAETITAGQRVEYNPISTSFESLTLYYHLDGVLHKLLGARGTVSGKQGIGDKPVMSFKFTGIDGGISAVANPALTLTAWKAPLVITDHNSASIKLGCSYAAGALSGGTAYTSRGLEWDLGADVQHVPLLGGESVDIVNRAATAKFSLDLTAAQHVSLMDDVKSNNLTGLGLMHGTTAGYKVLLFAPKAQLISPKYEDVNGRVLVGFDARLTPSAGNDELKIVAL